MSEDEQIVVQTRQLGMSLHTSDQYRNDTNKQDYGVGIYQSSVLNDEIRAKQRIDVKSQKGKTHVTLLIKYQIQRTLFLSTAKSLR